MSDPILKKLSQVRLSRIDPVTGDSALLATWPRTGIFNQLRCATGVCADPRAPEATPPEGVAFHTRLAALDDGSLALIAARKESYTVWRLIVQSDGIAYGGHFLGLGQLLGQPVMSEQYAVLAVDRKKALEYVTLSPDRFHGKGQCGAL